MERKAWINIGVACDVLNVKRSSYYSWVKRQSVRPASADEERELEQLIITEFTKSRNTYGAPRIVDALEKKSKSVGYK